MNIGMEVETNGMVRTYRLTSGTLSMIVKVTPKGITTLVAEQTAGISWRGGGKTFHRQYALVQARESYKSETCRAMIDAVRQEEEKLSEQKKSC